MAEIGRVAARGLSRIRNEPGKNMIMKCYADMNLVFLKVLLHINAT